MQDSFLNRVLSLLTKRELPLSSYTFVLPSKRSGTFLKKYISEKNSTPSFSPNILSIEDFISDLAGITPATSTELLLQLYLAYKKTGIMESDDFNTFLKWGPTLLQDFNEIDRYLVPSKEILNYLSAIKEMDHWSLQKDKTQLVQNYLSIWSNLEPIYDTFTSSLTQQEKAYQGLIYKTAVDKLQEYHQNKHMVFIGFNALNNAESKIIQYFLQESSNQIFWDIDSYFIEDPLHDAGLFIRNYLKQWPYYQNHTLAGIHSDFLKPKNINITGVPKSMSQAKYAGNILQEIISKKHADLIDTAIVLADESLLTPVLDSIPNEINKVNITMGLPLGKTVLCTFFQNHLDLTISKTVKGWYHKDVLEFLSNPYSSMIAHGKEISLLQKISKDIKTNNWLYLNEQHLDQYSDSQPLLNVLFSKTNVSASIWLNNALLLINRLKEAFQKEENNIELECLYRFHMLFNQLLLLLGDVDFVTDLKSLRNLFKQLVSVESLDYIGEPLSGLQVMGMLESRNLDFETVILTSVNEGILPSGKSNNSFIPYDVKREYGLPTYKEKDAIYTYHFYRLIQRAKNIHIIYNTEPDVLEGGEKSRLISQLLTDGAIAEHVTHNIASPEVKISKETPTIINKTPLLLNSIYDFARNGFSPSSLSNYIRNPIEFYKKGILAIRDMDDVEETIAANTFGTIVHDSLEKLYTPLIGEVLTKENLSPLLPEIKNVVFSNFKKTLPGANLTKGKHLLVFNVILKYLQTFVSHELEAVENNTIRILELEKRHTTQLQYGELNTPITLKGTVDRVDEINGVKRIVDYKTGKVESKNVRLKDWDTLITDYDKSKAFQLLCYAFLYCRSYGAQELRAGIYSFKNLGHGFLPFQNTGEIITAETLEQFEVQLKRLILEICNPSIPLVEKETELF